MNFAPILNGYQAFTDGGIPLAGGLIYTYQAGTSTPQTAYFNSSGSIAHSNPIVLGADGRPPGEIWLNESTAYKFSLFDSLLNPIDEWDNIRGIQVVTSSNWVPTGLAPIFLNATQFQIANNVVSAFPVGIRIQYFLGITPFYGSITAATFSGGFTRITVAVDSIPLDSSLSAVSVSALSPTNTSVPVVFNQSIRFNQDITVFGEAILSSGASVGNVDDSNFNVLDWYLEDVSFTPSWQGLTTAGVTVYTTRVGHGTRIGNMFFFTINLGITSNTGTGVAIISGMPYLPNQSFTTTVNMVSDTTLPLAMSSTVNPVPQFQVRRSDTFAGFNAPAAINNTFLITGSYQIEP